MKSNRFDAPIAPDEPFFAVGDIHGCAPQMQQLLAMIQGKNPDAPIIFVGDYIDRGPQSAAVLRSLMALDMASRVTCLIGNHEDMLLDFLDHPRQRGARWLKHGGIETLASFGLHAIDAGMKDDALDKLAAGLNKAMGAPMIGWLRALPTHWISGNIAVVHAAADPRLPITNQQPRILRWGHPDFDTKARSDNTWVLYGHRIVGEAHATRGRIAIDTGAYATGRLTAAYITDQNVEFLQT